MTAAPLSLGWADRERIETTSKALGEPAWLLDDRLDALGRLAELPAEPNELFRPYLDLRSVDLSGVEPFAPAEAGTPGDDRPAPVLPDGAAALVEVGADGRVTHVLGDEARAGGLTVETIAEATASRPDDLRERLGGGASLPDDDAFGQVARAFATTGLVIRLPAGLTLADPIVLRYLAGAERRALVTRTLVELGEGAHAHVYESQQAASPRAAAAEKADSQWWGTTEVFLARGSTLDFAGEQDLGPSTAAFVSRQARVGADASIGWAIASIGARFHRSRIDNLLEGRGAAVQQAEIGFGDASQLFDLTSYTRHRAPDTTSDLLSKGVFSGRSRGYIKGLIDIAREARGTDTFLGEFSMLLERTARSVTVPSLEIDQPDVRRAMHSSSVGPIDEGQIFYLMSRGLPRDAARKAIVLGFLEPVVARIPLPEAQERLRALLDRKWPSSGPSEAAA